MKASKEKKEIDAEVTELANIQSGQMYSKRWKTLYCSYYIFMYIIYQEIRFA